MLRIWGPGELNRIIQIQAQEDGIELESPTKKEQHGLCSFCKFSLDNELKINLLVKAIKSNNLFRDVAMARLLNLYEISMLRQINN
jgi:hypothetical protein